MKATVALPAVPARTAATEAVVWQARLRMAAVVGPPFLYLLLFYLVPLAGMVLYSFGAVHAYEFRLTGTLEQYQRFLGTPEIRRLLLKSLRIAGMVTGLTLLVGYPAAYVLARVVTRRWQYPLLLLLVIPSWTSFIIRTYSWLLILGQHGLVNSALQGLGLITQPLALAFNQLGVVVVLTYIYLPWLIFPIYVALEKIDPSLVEAGEILGANRLQVFARVILPLSMPGVVAGALIVFVPSVGEFAVPVIVGGTGGYMYGNLINFQFLALNWPFGAALAVVMLLVTLALVAAGTRLVRLEELWGAL